jgi:hypothetical protein
MYADAQNNNLQGVLNDFQTIYGHLLQEMQATAAYQLDSRAELLANSTVYSEFVAVYNDLRAVVSDDVYYGGPSSSPNYTGGSVSLVGPAYGPNYTGAVVSTTGDYIPTLAELEQTLSGPYPYVNEYSAVGNYSDPGFFDAPVGPPIDPVVDAGIYQTNHFLRPLNNDQALTDAARLQLQTDPIVLAMFRRAGGG